MEKNLDICLLNDSFPPLIDGVANTVKNYASVLKKDNGNPIVITPDNPNNEDSTFDYPIIRYPALDTTKIVGYYAGYPFSPSIVKKIQNHNISLLHSHCPVASQTVARCLRNIIDKPIVFTYHTKFDVDIKKAIPTEILQESAIKFIVGNIEASDEVWVVSEGAGKNLRSLGYQGEYIVMNNGVDIPRGKIPYEKYMALTNPKAFKKNVPTFLFVGRLMWYKGIKIILDALSGLKSQDIDFRMIFIGKGQDEKEIKKYAKDVKVYDKCTFTGPIYDREVLSSYYSRADIFLFPSEFDTNGLVVREAAALSMPSVLINGSAAAEGVKKNETGFLIDSNPASLAALLVKLTSNMGLVKHVGEMASNELYLSWDDAIKVAEDRYQVIIEKYKSGKCKKHNRITDELLKFPSTIMESYYELQKSFDKFLGEI